MGLALARFVASYRVASSGMDFAAPTLSVYAMTKAAVASLGRTAAIEGAYKKVRVNTIAPGATITAFTEVSVTDGDGNVNQEALDGKIKMLRLEELEMSDNDVCDAGYTAFALAVQRGNLRKLRSLYFVSNLITDEGANALAQAIAHNKRTKLFDIRLGFQNISDPAGARVAVVRAALTGHIAGLFWE